MHTKDSRCSLSSVKNAKIHKDRPCGLSPEKEKASQLRLRHSAERSTACIRVASCHSCHSCQQHLGPSWPGFLVLCKTKAVTLHLWHLTPCLTSRDESEEPKAGVRTDISSLNVSFTPSLSLGHRDHLISLEWMDQMNIPHHQIQYQVRIHFASPVHKVWMDWMFHLFVIVILWTLPDLPKHIGSVFSFLFLN